MNNRQAGAFRELVRKEERCREKWYELHSGATNTAGYGYLSNGTTPTTFNGLTNGTALTNTTTTLFQSPVIQTGPNVTIKSQTELDRQLPALATHNVYDQAIRISSPRLIEELTDEFGTLQRRVIRQVEVPYLRQVKVPVKTRKIIPVIVQKKIKTKKLMELPSSKIVDEEYTEVLQQPAVRNKEIWVKKKIGTVVRQIVPERYLKPVEVKRTRKVQIPSTVLREIDDYEVVDVTENKAVEVDGYRVDEVQDSRLVEVEEIQSTDIGTHGISQVIGTREIGPVRGIHHARRIGTEVYHPLDERHKDIDEDSIPDDTQRVTTAFNRLSHQQQQAVQQEIHRGSRTTRFMNKQNKSTFAQTARNSLQNNSYNNNNTFNLSSTQPVPQSARAPSQAQPFGEQNTVSAGANINTARNNDSTFTHKIGFIVHNSDANGCVVTRVDPNEAGARGGINKGDIVIYANNRPTRNLNEFRAVLVNSSGPIQLQIRRRGVGKLLLTVQR